MLAEWVYHLQEWLPVLFIQPVSGLQCLQLSTYRVNLFLSWGISIPCASAHMSIWLYLCPLSERACIPSGGSVPFICGHFFVFLLFLLVPHAKWLHMKNLLLHKSLPSVTIRLPVNLLKNLYVLQVRSLWIKPLCGCMHTHTHKLGYKWA